MIKPMGRIGLVGTSWDAIDLDLASCVKEPELIPSMGYSCKRPNRNFEEAGMILVFVKTVMPH